MALQNGRIGLVGPGGGGGEQGGQGKAQERGGAAGKAHGNILRGWKAPNPRQPLLRRRDNSYLFRDFMARSRPSRVKGNMRPPRRRWTIWMDCP